MSPEVKKFIETYIEDIESGDFQKVFSIARHMLTCAHVLELQSRLCISGICCKSECLSLCQKNHRIHQIKCYNVGFGDCFLCKGENEDSAKMLVDFGGAKNFKMVKNDLKHEFSSADKRYLMLSHLHKDHYSGLTKVNDGSNVFLFDEIYLSDYIASGGIEFMGEVLLSSQDNILLNLVRSILKIPALLFRYVKDDTKVYLLCQGNVVYNSLCSFEVLLPLKNNKFYLHHRGDLEDLIRSFAKEYIKLLDYSPYSNGETSCIQVYSNNLGEVIDRLIDDLIQKGQERNVSVDEKILKERFDNYHNSLSLAFHELSVPDQKNVLFLGDAEPTDIDAIVKSGKVANQYYFVKVQHHGTKNHFYNALPTAQYYAISNGGNRDSWEISALYDAQYGALRCINNCNCELAKKGVSCKSKAKTSGECGTNASFISIKIT